MENRRKMVGKRKEQVHGRGLGGYFLICLQPSHIEGELECEEEGVEEVQPGRRLVDLLVQLQQKGKTQEISVTIEEISALTEEDSATIGENSALTEENSAIIKDQFCLFTQLFYRETVYVPVISGYSASNPAYLINRE